MGCAQPANDAVGGFGFRCTDDGLRIITQFLRRRLVEQDVKHIDETEGASVLGYHGYPVDARFRA